jgi:hypothetical protein
MASVKEQRKLKGVPRKSNKRRQERKYLSYRMRVGRPNGPGRPGNKAGKNKLTHRSGV